MSRTLASVLLPIFVGSLAAAPPSGFSAKVPVSAETRIDWTFALANQSLAKPPADWLGKYKSTEQTFDLYSPPRPNLRMPMGLVLFISPSNSAMGFKQFEAVCKQRGLLFAAVRGAGNSVDPKKRIRIVLDVLDQIRRKFTIDPDRTYLAGFSGGGRIACAIGFALPEYFGGVIPICAAGDLRSESWLRHRVIDRLSIALLTGETDFNRGEVERFRGPYLKDIGVRTRVWVQPKLGHGVPSATVVAEAIAWLDAGVPQRQKLARTFPSTRIVGDPPSRQARAASLLAEAKARAGNPKTQFSGLMLMQGVMKRWPDLDESQEARKLLLEYESQKEKPWEQADLAEQRKFLVARARSLTSYATGDLPRQYAQMRPKMAESAISMWKQVLADSPMSTFGAEAKKQIPMLEKLLDAPK